MRNLNAHLAWTLTLALLGACAEPTASADCQSDGDCPPGLDCHRGACTQADTDDVGLPDRADSTPLDVVDTIDDLDVGTTTGGFGTPCISDDDCVSDFCTDTRRGPICSETCLDDRNCESGFVCRLVDNFGPDSTLYCVEDDLCRPCRDRADCRGRLDACLPQRNGTFCATPCERACPVGYDCNRHELEDPTAPEGLRTVEVCEPREGACNPLRITRSRFSGRTQGHSTDSRLRLRGRFVFAPGASPQADGLRLTGGFL